MPEVGLKKETMMLEQTLNQFQDTTHTGTQNILKKVELI